MESTHEQSAEALVVVRVLGRVLEKLVAANGSHTEIEQGQVTKFHALKAPSIGILQYLERIHKYASCSTECFILALIYIDRLIQGNNFLLTELNVHRVAITSILLAAKFFDDAYYNNAYYAKVGGVLVSEMNRLEVEFLFRINFSLHVSPELYNKYHAQLNQHVVGGNPISSPAVFVQSNDITEPAHQVKLSSCDYGGNNASALSTHMQDSPHCIHSTDQYASNDDSVPETQQFVAGIPLQITPSPPAPHIHEAEVLPTNTGNDYSSMNSLSHNHHPCPNEQSILKGNVDEIPITVHQIRTHHVVHDCHSNSIQPKACNPWGERYENPHYSKDANPYEVATGCGMKEATFYVGYKHFPDDSPMEAQEPCPNLINHHSIIQYQQRSVSATSKSPGFHHQGW